MIALTAPTLTRTLRPNVPSFTETYAHHADRYDDLVRHEDSGRNLDAFFADLFPARVAEAVEIGCGTGRVTRLLARHAERLRAYDGSEHMIAFARDHARLDGVSFAVADNAALPEADQSVDAVVAGWTIGHVTGFFPDDWRAHAERALGEMARVARSGARLVVIETLGTCVDAAGPPNEPLRELYRLFEEEHGFERSVLDTRYTFPSAERAAETMGFFFGDQMRDRVQARGTGDVPEYTGVWTRLR